MAITIYAITNTETRSVYVGSTNNPRRRWADHRRELKNNEHHSVRLQAEWNEYGPSSFEFDILEDGIPAPERLIAEGKWYADLPGRKLNGCVPGGGVDVHQEVPWVFRNRSCSA